MRCDRTGRRHLGWVLLAPFLLLSLIAPTVMAARAADGGVTVVICLNGGPVEARMDPRTGEPLPAETGHGSSICDWQAARLAVAPENGTPLPLPPGLVDGAPLPIAAGPPAPERDRFRSPPARGPPLPV